MAMLSCAKRELAVGRHRPIAEDESETMDRLAISGTGSETLTEEDGSKYTVYVLRCAMFGTSNTTWEVRRRYSEFHELHNRMKGMGTVLAELPSKNPFAKISAVVRSREIGLQEYMNGVLGHCNDEQCKLLSKFLRVNKHIRPAQAEKRSKTGDIRVPPVPEEQKTLKALNLGGKSTGIPGEWQKRSQSVPRGRTREIVAGVPESSLRTRDDSEANSARTRSPGHLACSSSSTEEGMCPPRSSAWEQGMRPAYRPSRVQAECGSCEPESVETKPSTQHATSLRNTVRQQQQAIIQGFKQQCRGKASSWRQDRAVSGSVGKPKLDSSKAGVGLFFVQVQGGQCVVDEIISGGSAEREGSIKVGDVLIRVCGCEVSEKDLSQIRAMIIGEPGSTVALDVVRQGLLMNVNLVRSVPAVGEHGQQAEHRVGSAIGKDAAAESDCQPCPEEQRDVQDREVQQLGHTAADTQLAGWCVGEGHCETADLTARSEHRDEGTICGSSICLEIPAGRDGGLRAGAPQLFRALACFNAQRQHELTLAAGDVLVLTRKHESGWWEGVQTKGGAKGWFPSNHVEAIEAGGQGGHRTIASTPKRLSAGSSTSAQSLSRRSTVLANDATSCDSDMSSELAPKTPDKRVQDMTVDDVCMWLAAMDLGEYSDAFRSNKIDGELLLEVEEGELEADFGMTNKYHRKRLLKKLTTGTIRPVSVCLMQDSR